MDTGIAMQVQWARAGKHAIDAQAAQASAFEGDIESGREIKLERKWRKDDQDVKAQISVNGKAGSGSVSLNIGAELQRV